ncbi:MAG TPA: cell division protein FtsZ [Rhizomicrobium sp.]|nr:cell division protein FtsZ [Rhizomicrobium sp.]
MTIKLNVPEVTELRPRITVLGVGGAGGNAVNNMISAKLEGVEFIVANTDAQALAQSKAQRRIQVGARVTEGLGAGARPDVGRAGAEESLEEILDQLAGSHMVFITAGMGGGTGTGAAPVIARAVREQGVLTVGVVTKPFAFEGNKRMRIAERGIEELQAYVDTLIIIPNQNLFRVANDRTTFSQAFAMADDVLHSGVRGVTDLIVMPGLINLDFADIKTVMSEMGKAMMGTGEAEGEDRALKAAEAAISNPLLDDVSMKGARALLINITGGPDLTLLEADQAANRIRAEVDPDANIIFGGCILENMEGRLRVSVVATGIEADEARMPANVEQFRPRAKVPPAAPAAKAHPVHSQVEIIAQELNATVAAKVPHPEAAVAYEEAPVPALEPAVAAAQVSEPVRVHTLPSPPMRTEPEPERRRSGWSIFRGRNRHEAERAEPQMTSPGRAAESRATVEVMPRTAAPQQRATSAAQADAADLFPDFKKEDQFEIPAFLRRQTN